MSVDDAQKWHVGQDINDSKLLGGSIRTHYDAACEVSDWIGQVSDIELNVISLGGDEMGVAWLVIVEKLLVVRPSYMSDSEDFENVDKLIKFYKDSRLESELEVNFNPGEYVLMMGCDFFNDGNYANSTCRFVKKICKVTTRLYHDDENYIIFHEFVNS